MAVRVRENIDYKDMKIDYRRVFYEHNKPLKTKKENVNGQMQTVGYYRCMYCGNIVPHYQMEVDHIIPKTRMLAGILWNPNKSWNLGPSCKPCNGSKSNYIDERVLIGFKNRKLGRCKMKLSGTDKEYSSGDMAKGKWKIYTLMGLIYTIGFLSPFILILLRALEGILIFGKRALTWLFRGRISKTFRKAKRILKYTFKHPIRTAGVIVGTTLVVAGTAMFLGYQGASFGDIMGALGKYLSKLT